MLGMRLAACAAALAAMAAASFGAEAMAPGPKQEKTLRIIELKEPFSPLVEGGQAERAAAFRSLVAGAGELAERAKAEAERLRAAAPEEGTVTRSAWKFAVASLDAIAAEPELMRSWKPGPSPAAEKAREKELTLNFQKKPVAEMLREVSAQWGVSMELSPAAAREHAALDVDVEGSVSLGQFLEWLSSELGLVCGHVGDRLVLVIPASVRLKESMGASVAKEGKG